MADEGETAPDFTLPTDGGGSVTLSELRGAPVVLFFYPRDDTSGCTREAKDFTELRGAFDGAGVRLVGISRDDAASHDRFKAKHDLAVTLASDEDGTVCEAYGVWVQKSMYGKSFMGIERTTVLVDAEGRIARLWRKVKVPGHAEAVLEAARAL